MSTWYVGCVEIEGSNYGIWFPDLPGCISAGDSFREIMEMGEEALNGHIAFMRMDDDPVPVPRTLAQIEADVSLQKRLAGMFFVNIPLHETAPSAIAAE